MTQVTTNQDGQPASQPVASGTPQQSAPVAQQREDGFWVERRNLPEGYDQWQDAFGAAKRYKGLERDGVLSLYENAKAQGLSPHQLNQLLSTSPEAVKSLLNKEDETPGQQYGNQPQYPQQYQQPDPYAQMLAQYQQQYGQQAQQPPPGLTLDQLNQWATQQQAQMQSRFEKLLEEKLSAKDKELADRDQRIGMEIEYDDAMSKAVKDLIGRDLAPTKFDDFLGRTREMDMDAEDAKVRIAHWARRAYEEQLPTGPDGDRMRKLPTPAKYVKLAAAQLKPLVATKARSDMESMAASQAQIPGGTVPSGPAGRPQLNTSEMTPEQLAEEAARRYAKRKAGP